MGKVSFSAGVFVASVAVVALTALSAQAQSKAYIFGDSHTVGFFGDALKADLEKSKLFTSVETRAKVGWSAATWAKSDAAGNFTNPEFIAALHDRTAGAFVVALGTNDANNNCQLLFKGGEPLPEKGDETPIDLSRDPFFKNTQMVKGIIDAGKKCYWVGPPVYDRGPIFADCGAKYQKYVDGLKIAVAQAGCVYVDSRPFHNATGGPLRADARDSVHFNKASGIAWGQQAAAEVIRLAKKKRKPRK